MTLVAPAVEPGTEPASHDEGWRLRRSLRRAAALVLLGCAVVFTATAIHETQHVDVMHAEVAAWRIATTGSADVSGVDISAFNPPETRWTVVAPNGHLVAHRTPGVVAAAVPAYVITSLVSGSDDHTISGFSPIPGGVTAALMTSVAVALLVLALGPLVGTRAAVGGALALGLTTPVWTIAADGMWPHTVTILAICGMAWGCVRERWWLVGLFGGVGLWGRLHVVLVVAVLGLGLSLLRRDWRPVVRIGLVSGSFLGLATLWTHWMYGVWSPTGGYRDKIAFATEHTSSEGLRAALLNQAGLWVSPDRGILVWTPVVLVLLPTAVLLLRRGLLPDWSVLLVVGGLAYTSAQGLLNGFDGGDGFYGQRLGLEMVACATPALVVAFARASVAVRRVALAVVAVQLVAMLVGAGAMSWGIPKQDAWRHNAFVESLRAVPALWILVGLAVCSAIVLSRRLVVRGDAGTAAGS